MPEQILANGKSLPEACTRSVYLFCAQFEALSAGIWRTGENHSMSVESTLEVLLCFAVGGVGAKVRMFLQNTQSVRPAQHRHYH